MAGCGWQVKPMSAFKRWWLPLTLSLLIHVVLLAANIITLPDWSTPETKVLQTKLLTKANKAKLLQSDPVKVAAQLAIKPDPAEGMAASEPAASERAASDIARTQHASHRNNRPARDQQAASLGNEHAASIGALARGASTEVPKIKPEASASQPSSKPDKPADKPADKPSNGKLANYGDSFPRAGTAKYQMLKGPEMTQRWEITGEGYRIVMGGSLFNKSIRWESRGRIGKDGILPDKFAEYRDEKTEPKYAAAIDYAQKVIHYGSPDDPKEVALESDTQDLLTWGYQLAAQLEPGQSFDLQLVFRNKVYPVRFVADREEVIEVPAGKIRTAHVRGQVVGGSRRFDVWLDLDHFNYPVRIVGTNDEGQPVDLVLLGLKFGDQVVYQYRAMLETGRDNK